MAILKCKMCGGDIELSADKTYGICDSCGSTMTFPRIDDDQRAAQFNRGNHFRRTGEFDRALAIYENIVRENENDAEAHWCCALCRFGIEYVEDPVSYEYIPTCHRASFDSFLEDVDYLAAVEHSEGITRRQYQRDAAKIAEVQRGILATSQNEKPFDVFICYKESENDGTRTRDSLMAQDIYYQLTDKGWRVFFSRITLEDKAGTEYEPYIFAALNSAKVMVVVTTTAEHVNAVWVKNEWSRYLALMRKDRTRLLLPCYRDMDPYDLPEALSVLQSYDMGKIGFIQDLIRGVSKVLEANAPKESVKETVVVNGAAANISALLRRASMFLEDGEWNRADDFCEQVLNQDPENAQAYLGKLMAEMKVRRQEDLADCAESFERSNNYQKVVRFGDEGLSATLKKYIDNIKYNCTVSSMNTANTEAEYKAAAESFKSITGYKDADALAEQCLEAAEVCREQEEMKAQRAKEEAERKDEIYLNAKSRMKSDTVYGYEVAIERFSTISGWKDAEEQIAVCRQKIAEIKGKEVKEAERKDEIYLNAKSRMKADTIYGYGIAIEKFRSISGWKDADELIVVCQQKIEEIRSKQEADSAEIANKEKKRKGLFGKHL